MTSLVSRSDCRKGLRWKSAEVEDPASFMNATRATAENASRGFDCRVEDHEGFINCVCLTRHVHVLHESMVSPQDAWRF